MSTTGGLVAGPTTRTEDADGPRARSAMLAAQAWPAGWGALVGAILFVAARNAMPDDALISLSFARNLAEHGEWALTTGVEVHTATSPLNIWLLAGLHLATAGQAFLAAGLLLCVCLAVVATLLHRLGGVFPAIIGPAMLASSPVMSSSVGLETFLTAAVLLTLVSVAVAGRWLLAGIGVAAMVLTRPDLVVPALVVIAVLAARRPRLLLALPVGVLVSTPWFAFCWWHFGSAWPHTVAIKMANGAWAQGSITTVPYFFGQWPVATVITLATFVGGVAATALAWRRHQEVAGVLGLAGAAHLLALAVQSTPPIEYYLAPAVIGLGLALVLTARGGWRSAPVAIVLTSVALSVAHGSLWAEGLAPMRQNWATNPQYEAIARDLPTDGVVLSTTEIGALAFYCQDRGCTVVDEILADPAGVDRFVARWRAEHGWADANYARYREPPAIVPAYRLDFGPADLRPGDWPITRVPGVHQVARLVPLR